MDETFKKSKSAPTASPVEAVQVIRVRADAVEKMEDGVFEIYIPALVLSAEAQKMLKHLFPDVQEGVKLLLQKQALLFSIL